MTDIQRSMSIDRLPNLASGTPIVGRWRLGVGFLLLVLGFVTDSFGQEMAPRQALRRAADFLWSQQASDGSWRSEYYGVMRSGQSLTPFVLHALLLAEEELTDAKLAAAHRAAKFIISSLDHDGAIGRSDPDVLEYPVYSTSYAIKSFELLQELNPEPDGQIELAIERMQEFLLKAQYQESNGFWETDVAYGGWGFNAPEDHGVVGHMDLAHTHKALAALSTYKDRQILEAIRKRANSFLLLMQRDPTAGAAQPHPIAVDAAQLLSTFDGGFYFTPIALSANKAPYDEQRHCWPSYATATCEGMLALLAAGIEPNDERAAAAKAWLRKHRDVDYPEGVPRDHPEPWGEAVRFYHYSVRAEAYRRFGFSREDRTRLITAILAHQRSNGSFVNTSSPLMKEDDPLVCTGLAVSALAHCLDE